MLYNGVAITVADTRIAYPNGFFLILCTGRNVAEDVVIDQIMPALLPVYPGNGDIVTRARLVLKQAVIYPVGSRQAFRISIIGRNSDPRILGPGIHSPCRTVKLTSCRAYSPSGFPG